MYIYLEVLKPYLSKARRTLEMGAGCGLMSIEAVLSCGVEEAWAVDVTTESPAYVILSI